MKKNILLASLAAAVVFSFATPAVAETFTSSDGVLSIELPNDGWKEMSDPTKWIALSDGSNLITIDHLSNGDPLPDIAIADDHYVNVYQATFSTQNEVFIITGYVVDAAKIAEMANTIVSTKVLKYDTKTKKAPATEQAAVSDFSVVATDATKYVASDGLNVRSGCSTSDKIIGAYAYGSSVHVTGVIQKNGQDFGWYQVDYNGGTGYVSSAYLSDTAPAAKPQTSKTGSASNSSLTFTGVATTVYAMSGTAVTIYKATDGNWYDGNGTKFTWLTDSKLTNEGGDSFTTYNTTSGGTVPTGSSITVYWTNGNAETLTQYSDGNYYSSSGVMYFDAGGGAYAGADGTTLYTQQPQLGTAGSSLTHGLSSQGSGRPVEVTSSDGGVYYDNSGTAYYAQGDGTFVDSNGDVFNVEW